MAEPELPVNVAKESSDTALTREHHWHPFEGLRREIDRLFHDYEGGGGWTSPFRARYWTEPFAAQSMTISGPAVNLAQRETSYEITAELPGVDQKDIEVKLAEHILTIKGKKQEEQQEEQKEYFVKERRFGSFERRFALPEDVDKDNIEASFSNGILKVTLPKMRHAEKVEKTIPLKGASSRS